MADRPRRTGGGFGSDQRLMAQRHSGEGDMELDGSKGGQAASASGNGQNNGVRRAVGVRVA
jgi:hypothetical protein